jgi:hypothetical protein
VREPRRAGPHPLVPRRHQPAVLQSLRPAVAEDLFEIMRAPALGAFTGEPTPESVAAMRERIEEWMRGPGPGRTNAG